MSYRPLCNANYTTRWVLTRSYRVMDNKLLAKIPAKELDRLLPRMRQVQLPYTEVLYDVDQRIESAYFPTSGVVSMVNEPDNGEILEFATIEGARCAGLDHKVGTLTPGKDADIVVLAADRLNVWPLNNAPGVVVNLMNPMNVDTVFVAGKVRIQSSRRKSWRTSWAVQPRS